MSKVWLVAERQFREAVLKRTFLIVLLSLPGFLALTIGMGALSSRLNRGSTTLGYVDQAGLIVRTPAAPADHELRLTQFGTPEAARSALEAGQIDAYYVLPADYRASHHAELIYFERPDYEALHYFADMLRLNLLAGRSPAVVERAMAGAVVRVRATALNREFPAGGPGASDMAPLVAATLFAFLVLTVSGTLMEAVVEEKENRTMEIVVSSVSPNKMMAGKVIGILGIAVTLLAGWALFLTAAVWLGGTVLDVGWMQNLHPRWRDLGLLGIAAIPSFLFIAAFMALLSALIVDSQEAQQIGPLMFLVLFLPIYVVVPIAQHPNGALAIGASLLPATAVSTIAIRSLFMEVPAAQFIASAAISLVSGVVVVWLAGRTFRLSMLRYGQRLRLGELFSQLRGRSS